MDEDSKIRGYVRAHNMDNKGNSKFNPLTGENRAGVDLLVPQELTDRFEQKKFEHYDQMRLKVPSAKDSRANNYNRYY